MVKRFNSRDLKGDIEDAVFEDLGKPSPQKGQAQSAFKKSSVFSGVVRRVGHAIRAFGEEIIPSMAIKAREQGRRPGLF